MFTYLKYILKCSEVCCVYLYFAHLSKINYFVANKEYLIKLLCNYLCSEDRNSL